MTFLLIPDDWTSLLEIPVWEPLQYSAERKVLYSNSELIGSGVSPFSGVELTFVPNCYAIALRDEFRDVV